MLPLRFMPGAAVYEWNRRVWIVLIALGLFGFAHVLLNPSAGYLADTTRTSFFTLVLLLVGFGFASVAVLGLFPIPAEARGCRNERPSRAADRGRRAAGGRLRAPRHGRGLRRGSTRPSSSRASAGLVRLRLRDATAVGKVLAIDPPQHISFTWDWEAEPLGQVSVVAFDAIDHGARTHVTLRHVGLPTPRRSSCTRRCGATGWSASRRPRALPRQGRDDPPVARVAQLLSSVACGCPAQLGRRRSSRSSAGSSTSASAPQPRIQILISRMPGDAAAPDERCRPSAARAPGWGASASRPPAWPPTGRSGSRRRTGSSSAITSHARSSSRAVASPSGGSNVSGVSDADRMRSTLNVRRRLARLVPADQVQRMRQRRRLDRQRMNARPARALGRVVDAGVVLDLDDAPLRPGLGQHAEDARERLVRSVVGRKRVDRVAGCARPARAAGSGPASRTRRSAPCRARRSSWPASARRGTGSSPRGASAPTAAGSASPSRPYLPPSFQIGSPARESIALMSR